MQLIETIEVGSGGAASIEFTSIPQDGVDLVLVFSCRTDNATVHLSTYVTFNSDTSANYDWLFLRGSGTSADSVSVSGDTKGWVGYIPGSSSTANTFGNTAVYISNYTSSAAKSFSSDNANETNAASVRMAIDASKWSGTDAISSIQLFGSSDNFVQYSTASLYKITAD